MVLDPLTAAFELVKLGAEKIWPDANKRAEQLQKLEELKQAGKLAELNHELSLVMGQLEINKVEAGHESRWVSGWRPFIGWVCGSALAYTYILEPLMRYIAVVGFEYNGPFPQLQMATLENILFGLLGLGTMRSIDKAVNVISTKVAEVKKAKQL